MNFGYLDDLIHSGAKEIILDSDILLDKNEKSKYRKGIKLDVDNLIGIPILIAVDVQCSAAQIDHPVSVERLITQQRFLRLLIRSYFSNADLRYENTIASYKT